MSFVYFYDKKNIKIELLQLFILKCKQFKMLKLPLRIIKTVRMDFLAEFLIFIQVGVYYC